MPVFSRGSLEAVQPSELGRLCYQTTARDLKGEALGENGRVTNMRAMRERQSVAAAGTRKKALGSSGSGSSTPSSPAKDFGLYTRYAGDYYEKPTLCATVSRELAEAFKPRPSDRPLNVGEQDSAYTKHFKGYTPSRVAAAKPMAFPEEDNKLGGLITQGSGRVTSSLSKRQFTKPPEELVVAAERMPYPGCPYWMGAGTSSASFKESRYQLEFRHAASPSKRPQMRRAFASAPDLAAAAEGGAEAQFRNATMRSHYKSQFSTAHQGPPDLRPPRAADIRQTIIGR